MNFWRYKNISGKVNIVYIIDGQEMGKYSAIHHMASVHNMSMYEANMYIENLQHL